jgi:acetyl-CoA carboxylase biotin carboxylase subunit
MKKFSKILVANRGEIALRIMRTCAAMGIRPAAVYAAPDRDAPFVRAADDAVYIGPPISSSSFLAVETIVEAARRVGAQAVHPGYGFLAENADFAAACEAAGIRFIGPTADSIRLMGSKVAAKRIMESAGVPVIPGFSAEGLANDAVQTRAQELGYPILVKASAGGGGKGMRIVREPATLATALDAARREAKHAFGDDTLLVERYFDAPRHIEVQILGDHHGHLIHCFERECSIQRRHQKIIEEAPSPTIDEDLRQRLCATALDAAGAIGYRNAGTVEFVVDRNGNFYFLEVNTRLQVEHPVTEEITGLDLVRLQISIAEGQPLALRQEDLTRRGHAIEARIYAEDPAADFLPSTGILHCWEMPQATGVRYESGVESGSEVTIHYDPLLAKVIAHADDRHEAMARLTTALGRIRAHGVRTNLHLLTRILRSPEFAAAQLSTHFIGDCVSAAPEGNEDEVDRVHALAAAIWLQDRRRAEAPVLRTIPSGWRNNPSQMQEVECLSGDKTISVKYRIHANADLELVADNVAHTGRVSARHADGIALEIDDLRREYRILQRDDSCYVHSPLGSSDLRQAPRYPLPFAETVRGGCLAPMPGRVIDVRVEPGQQVREGQTLIILEAMKMEHEVSAPHDGTVRTVPVEVGSQVEAGEVLVVLDVADEAS